MLCRSQIMLPVARQVPRIAVLTRLIEHAAGMTGPRRVG
jgi:hypothetical protein